MNRYAELKKVNINCKENLNLYRLLSVSFYLAAIQEKGIIVPFFQDDYIQFLAIIFALLYY